MARGHRALVALLLGATVPAVGQPRDPNAAQPERPTVATHAGVVATGWIEIETGGQRNQARGSISGSPYPATWDVPTVIKVGLGRRVQLNLGLPVHDGGLSNVSAGIKWRLGDDLPVLRDLAILPSINFPSGDGTTDFSLVLISSRTVGPISIDLNAGATLRTRGNAEIPRWATVWTVAAGLPLSGAAGWVAEWYGYPATSHSKTGFQAEGQVSFLTGPTLTATPWLVFDLGVIVPVSGSQDKGLYAGATVNAGRLWRASGK